LHGAEIKTEEKEPNENSKQNEVISIVAPAVQS
jgi:hypothetical protein